MKNSVIGANSQKGVEVLLLPPVARVRQVGPHLVLHMLLLRTWDHVAMGEFYRADEFLHWWYQG